MKIIKDLVHGYIEINPIEERIINTPNFQRLKDIRQLTCQHVFPSATHNRFEHSLGVMYLSREAFSNLNKLLKEKYGVSDSNYNRLLFHLTIASLLHDVGHAPYSHLGERYFRRWEIQNQIQQLIENQNLKIDKEVFTIGSKHELMSCYILLAKYCKLLSTTKQEFTVDYELLCRCIVGSLYNEESKWMEDIIIGLLNSTTIDMDKLDYLIRDAYMTGVSIPTVDIKRLFKNIFINPRSKKLSFCSQALPVIQNIIDARDSLYLWVYNHHTAVYSDFVIEFYIKHLILNYEKENKYEDKINPSDLFSCKAVSDLLVSDSDLYSKLKMAITLNDNILSKYTKEICPQLFERRFLKPLWKSIFEYRNFLENNIGDSTLINDLEKKMGDEDYIFRRYVAVEIIKKCQLSMGQVFIVPRSNKFYSLNPNNVFHIYLNDRDKEIGQLLPQKDFSKLYHNVAFYIFGVEEKIDEIKEAFIEVVSQMIPHKSDLSNDGTILKWDKE
jgi:HD superfamily phosphohydrolase